jgi:plastocyanin
MSVRSRSPRSALAFAAVLLVAGAGTALAGPVRGRIAGQEKLIPDVYVEAAKPDAHRYTWREPSPTVKAEFRALAGNPSRDVCIAALSSNNAGAHDPVLVRVTGGHTIPTTIVVSPGTRLSFENRDPFPHRLYQVGSPAWAAKTVDSSQHREWTAPAGQGRYEFRDELFPSVRTFVVVEPQVLEIAYPGRDGAFAMNLPAGDFVLKAYFNGRQVGRPMSVASKEKFLVELKDPINVGEATDGSGKPPP